MAQNEEMDWEGGWTKDLLTLVVAVFSIGVRVFVKAIIIHRSHLMHHLKVQHQNFIDS